MRAIDAEREQGANESWARLQAIEAETALKEADTMRIMMQTRLLEEQLPKRHRQA